MVDNDEPPPDDRDISPPPSFVRLSVVNKPSVVSTPASLVDDLRNVEEHRYVNVMIPCDEFLSRLQDQDCSKDELKVKRYKGS